MAVAKAPLDILPGFVKVGSPYSLSGRWVDGGHVRFVANYPQKIGGWAHLIAVPLTGVCRSLTSHNSPSPTVAFPKHGIIAGTHQRLYYFTYDGEFKNITPIRLSATPTTALSTTSGSPIVTVAHTAHGLVVGEIIEFAAAIVVGGLTLLGEYTVATVPGVNSYTFDAGSNATSTVGPTGSPQLVYYIKPGAVEVIDDAFGYPPRIWWAESYGSILLAVPTNGTLYQFDPDTMDNAVAVANAPTAEAMFLTDERFPMMLAAAGNPMKIMWPDQDDITVWTPSALNTANERILKEGTRIMAGAVLAPRLALIWTDLATYLVQYTGDNAVYATNVLATNTGLIGPKAFAVNDGVAYWMSPHGFHMSTGGQVADIPNQQEVLRYVMENCCPTRNLKATCFYNPTFNEVSWFIVATGAYSEPSLQITVNLESFAWWTDTMLRTAWMFDAYHQAPDVIAASAGGRLFRHEVGRNASDALALDDGVATAGLVMATAAAATFELQGGPTDFDFMFNPVHFDIGTIIADIRRLLWFEDGILQHPTGDRFTVDGSVVTFNPAAVPEGGALIYGILLDHTPSTFTFTGDGATVTFDLGETITDADRVLWFEDGIWQIAGTDFTISGTEVTRTTAPVSGASIFVYLLDAAGDTFTFEGDGETLVFDLGLGAIASTEHVLWFIEGIYQYPVEYFSINNDNLLAPSAVDPLVAYVKSAPFDIAAGNALVDVFGYVPDFEAIDGRIDIGIEAFDYPNEDDALEIVSESFSQGDGIVDLHVSGRQIAVTVTSADIGGHFRLGRQRLELSPAGTRR